MNKGQQSGHFKDSKKFPKYGRQESAWICAKRENATGFSRTNARNEETAFSRTSESAVDDQSALRCPLSKDSVSVWPWSFVWSWDCMKHVKRLSTFRAQRVSFQNSEFQNQNVLLESEQYERHRVSTSNRHACSCLHHVNRHNCRHPHCVQSHASSKNVTFQ